LNYIVKNNKFDRPFSEIRPGDYWESDARVVVANDRQLFAGWIGDHYPLHWDCGYAATTRYGSPILHELAVLSFAFGLVPLKAPQVITFYGLNRLMYVGDVVMASVRGLQNRKADYGRDSDGSVRDSAFERNASYGRRNFNASAG
jgi:acyl dehydratase